MGRLTPTRSIPASAGQPYILGGYTVRSVVYPRECGAARVHPISGVPRLGLSPRVRGSPDSWIREVVLGRSIPASAGQPSFYAGIGSQDTVYPRECGAAQGVLQKDIAEAGLSPRVRGSRLH